MCITTLIDSSLPVLFTPPQSASHYSPYQFRTSAFILVSQAHQPHSSFWSKLPEEKLKAKLFIHTFYSKEGRILDIKLVLVEDTIFFRPRLNWV
jgi:hypothetical protein